MTTADPKSGATSLSKSLRYKRSLINELLILIAIFLLSCTTTVPATIILRNKEILRGSATGSLGSDAVFSVKNVDGLSCQGKLFVPLSDTATDGTIECNDKRKGRFNVTGKKTSWSGEGKLDDGSRFFLSIGR